MMSKMLVMVLISLKFFLRVVLVIVVMVNVVVFVMGIVRVIGLFLSLMINKMDMERLSKKGIEYCYMYSN